METSPVPNSFKGYIDKCAHLILHEVYEIMKYARDFRTEPDFTIKDEHYIVTIKPRDEDQAAAPRVSPFDGLTMKQGLSPFQQALMDKVEGEMNALRRQETKGQIPPG